jgi:hypothetical protein
VEPVQSPAVCYLGTDLSSGKVSTVGSIKIMIGYKRGKIFGLFIGGERK